MSSQNPRSNPFPKVAPRQNYLRGRGTKKFLQLVAKVDSPLLAHWGNMPPYTPWSPPLGGDRAPDIIAFFSRGWRSFHIWILNLPKNRVLKIFAGQSFIDRAFAGNYSWNIEIAYFCKFLKTFIFKYEPMQTSLFYKRAGICKKVLLSFESAIQRLFPYNWKRNSG